MPLAWAHCTDQLWPVQNKNQNQNQEPNCDQQSKYLNDEDKQTNDTIEHPTSTNSDYFTLDPRKLSARTPN